MAKKRKGTVKRTAAITAAAEGNEESNAGGACETFDKADFLELEEDERLSTAIKKTRVFRSESNVEEIFGLSDVEDEDEGDVPAWGKKRKHFYGGNPNEFSKENEDPNDLDEAEAEAKESKALQMKQLQDLDEEDFMDAFGSSQIAEKTRQKKAKGGSDVSVETDLSKMSRKEKLQLFHRESPEFRGVVGDFNVRVGEGKRLQPLVNGIRNGMLPEGSSAARYVMTKHRILMNYCANLSAYLMFKTRRADLKFHPITSRLVQYKRMLDEMQDLDEMVDPVIEEALGALANRKKLKKIVEKRKEKKRKQPKKILNIIKPEEEGEKEVREEDLTYDERLAVQMYEAARGRKDVDEESSASKEGEKEEEEEEEGEDEGKRAITYQMAKNKGLKPKRSKLQRNPRVKHRVKFEKAKKKRKGQVREVRKEVKKYTGEFSGINARVKKGVKLM